MKNRRLRLIYNPYAGRRKLIGRLDSVIRIFQESGHEVTVHRTGSPEDIENRAAVSGDVEVLVIAGGDGSIHQAVNGLLKIPVSQRPTLGILPVGTANDLAYALRLPKSIPEACEVIARGKSFAMDTGLINDRYFVNVAGAGLLTDISPKVDTRVKNTLGQLAYYLKGLESLPSFRPFQLRFTHNGREFDDEVLLFLAVNGLSVGGMRRLLSRASLSDGKLDVLVIRQSGWPETLRMALKLLRGEEADSGKIELFQTTDLILETDRPMDSDLDGESGPGSPWHIKVGPKIFVLC